MASWEWWFTKYISWKWEIISYFHTTSLSLSLSPLSLSLPSSHHSPSLPLLVARGREARRARAQGTRRVRVHVSVCGLTRYYFRGFLGHPKSDSYNSRSIEFVETRATKVNIIPWRSLEKLDVGICGNQVIAEMWLTQSSLILSMDRVRVFILY